MLSAVGAGSLAQTLGQRRALRQSLPNAGAAGRVPGQQIKPAKACRVSFAEAALSAE
jgi:hypothetical protein